MNKKKKELSRKDRRKEKYMADHKDALEALEKQRIKRKNASTRQRNYEKNQRDKKLELKEAREARKKEIALKEGVSVSRVSLIGDGTKYIIKQAKPQKAPKQDTPKWRKKKGLV